MMYQDIFTVPAELRLFIIEKQERRTFMTNWNWTKYDYLCTDCDALIEITTLKNIREWRGWCPCGSANIINIGTSNGNAPIFEPVMKVTPPQLVKINTNPYN
jgi:hypothetical protein